MGQQGTGIEEKQSRLGRIPVTVHIQKADKETSLVVFAPVDGIPLKLRKEESGSCVVLATLNLLSAQY